MFLGTLGAYFLGNMLAGKGVNSNARLRGDKIGQRNN